MPRILSPFTFSPRSTIATIAAAMVSLPLTGCGLGVADTSTTPVTPILGGLSGKINGGPNPIIGATVMLYTTGNAGGISTAYGYATAAAEASAVTNPTNYPSGDTDINGSFSFPSGIVCPAGQFAYIVSAGGNTGASGTATGAIATSAITGGVVTSITKAAAGSGYYSATVTITSTDGLGSGATATAIVSNGTVSSYTVTNGGSGYDAPPIVTVSAPQYTNAANPQAVLVAALGRCEDLYATTSGGAYKGGYIYINELTTVAAAYALGHFSTVHGTGASTVILIGADATNNAAQVSGVSTGTTTAAAGLAHAFQNAANLVNVFSPSTSNGVGANYTTTSFTGATSNFPVVPQPLLNTLANILVSCVNSAGGTAGDGSACGKIFTYTTLPSSLTPSYTTSTPNQIFTAMVNLASNPSLNGSTANVTNLFNVAGAFTSAYSPALTSAPLNDYSIAINYPGTGSGGGGAIGASLGQGIDYTQGVALDVNDNAYIGSQIESGLPNVDIITISSNGNVLSVSPQNTLLKGTYALAVDGNSPVNGYFVNTAGSGTNEMGKFTATSGVVSSAPATLTTTNITAKPYGLAIDRANNVWAVGFPTSGTYNLFESTNNGTSFTGISSLAAIGSSSNTLSNQEEALAVDPNQNIWASYGTPNYPVATGAASATYVLQNTGSSTVPAYGTAPVTPYTAGAPSGGFEAGIAFAATAGTVYSSNASAAAAYQPYVTSLNTGGKADEASGIQPYTPTLSGAEVTAASAGTLTSGVNGQHASAVIGGSVGAETDGLGNIVTADYESHEVIYYNPTANIALPLKPCSAGYAIAAATITLSSGAVSAYAVNNGGWGYSAAPAVTISNPPNGTGSGAVATAVLGTGANSTSVASITVTTAGSGYSSTYIPVATIAPPTGFTTSCTNVFALGQPWAVAVDSAGSIWVTNTSGGNVVEIIGSAAPTWPLKSLSYLGLP